MMATLSHTISRCCIINIAAVKCSVLNIECITHSNFSTFVSILKTN